MQGKYKTLFIIVLLVLYCFAFQGSRGLFEPDEGRYSAVALQMIKHDDWLHPQTHPDQPHWTKPPLTYWAIAASLLTFGMNEFAVRFPNVLSFLITIVTCIYLGRIFNPQRPWLVALIFGTFLFPATMCNGSSTDYPLLMFETIAMCFFAHGFWGRNVQNQKKSLWFMWLFFGLAFLTKGPPSLLPLLSIIIFLQFKSGKKQNFNMFWCRGLLTLLIIGGSWYFYVIFEQRELAQYFLWDEIVLRLFTGHHQRHSQWYAFLYIYFPVLILGSLPWTVYFAKGLKRSLNKSNAQQLFLCLWIFVPLTVFIVSKSNLPQYILPLFVPAAIMAAQEIQKCNVPLRRLRILIFSWCLLIILVRPIMASIHFGKDTSQFAEALKNQYPQRVEEIVFANTRPAFGLQFYTGSDIKRVSFDMDELKNEFQGSEPRLWFVTAQDAPLFREKLVQLNVRMPELGAFEAWKDYVLFAENSDNMN